MLRTLLVSILALSTAASCSSKGDAPAAEPGVTAGRVIELTGTVTATRGITVRTLAAGGEISSDDVIDTAAESRVVILVAHNNARWDLGPNKHSKVSDSIAWTAAKQDRPATAVVEESSTAGRHAEKAAATTVTTTDDDMQTKGTLAEPMPEPPVQGAPPELTRSTSAPRHKSTPPADRPADRAADGLEAKEKERSVATRDEASAVAEPVKESASQSADKTSPGPGAGSATVAVGGDDDGAVDPVRELQREIREMFARDRVAMRACFDPTMPPVPVQITVTKGVYTITTVDRAATKKSRACLATIAKGLSSTTKLDKPVYINYMLNK